MTPATDSDTPPSIAASNQKLGENCASASNASMPLAENALTLTARSSRAPNCTVFEVTAR